ncbi:putative glyoxylase I [Jaminaea rosea]|uniref:lactoylglutathione lyase n=1 Tax=Jaminaea rosea TaxID=1569628 RepID=A0A316UXB7_9BASI|nr:putative glyoxylase I [Jaminaea rosea]PWN28563.1 putative glyoxylase I [Jaminaea rosea]
MAPAETKGYRLNHTMIRVKDPEKSLKFYRDILGMDLIDEHDADDFKLFFLAFPDSPSANAQSRAHREGILELTWNKGTEKQSDFSYHNGNDEPQGFGHTCISVPNLQEACDRLEKLGVEFKKRPQDGKMRKIAFAYDPDRYWVEIISTE